MKTISFIGNSEGPKKLLDIFKKMTPGSKGAWGNLQAIDNYDSDYYAIIDYLPSELKSTIDENKCIFIGAHPETMHAYRNLDKVKCFKAIDIGKERGFLEWWIKYDYDYLSNLQPISKSKNLACIMSDSNSQFYHTARREHLERFCNKYSQEVDVYGRLNPWGSIITSYKGACGSANPSATNNDLMSGKEQVYETYRYALEYDCPGIHYMSERVADAFLLWAMPIYWGGLGAEKYLPEDSFIKLDITGDGSDFINKLNEETYQKALPAIAKARNIILNEWQIFPMAHKAIFGTYK